MSDHPDYRIILVDQFSQKLLVAVTFLDTLIGRLKDRVSGEDLSGLTVWGDENHDGRKGRETKERW